MQDNLDLYISGKITASKRLVLMTTWCGNAWSQTDQGMVKRVFKKCGINAALDGSENEQLHIEKISDYVMPNIRDDYDEYELVESGNGSETDDQSNDDYRLESELDGDPETDNELQDDLESDNELEGDPESDNELQDDLESDNELEGDPESDNELEGDPETDNELQDESESD